MLYKSSYTDLQVLVRSPVTHYHPITGVEINRTKGLTANFGTHGGEFTTNDPLSGAPTRHALIHGNFFDTDAATVQHEWTQDEKESVEAALDKLAREQPFLVAKIEHENVPAAKPWPTFDETDWRSIPKTAISLGLANEALAYERENRQRPAVTEALEDHLKAAPPKQAVVVENDPELGVITLT